MISIESHIKFRNNLLKKFFISFLIAFVIFTNVSIQGQNLPIYSQYMFNGLALNPAYAGSKERLNASLLLRNQWVGVKGAPKLSTLSVHSPISNHHIGLGGMMTLYQVGVTNHYKFDGMYSYRIFFATGKLSIGLKAGLDVFETNFNELQLNDYQDVDFLNENQTIYNINFGLGMYYFTTKYYVGLSIPDLVNQINQNTSQLQNFSKHFFLHGGYLIPLNNDFVVKPNVLVHGVFGGALNLDINTNLYIKNTLCLGVSFRSMNSFVFLIETDYKNRLRFGYSYDLSTMQFSNFHKGSHEIMINYILESKKTKIVSPRYF